MSLLKGKSHSLGHKINECMIKMDENKVRVITEWSETSKLKELRSFLGLGNYYRWFIKGYLKMVASLTDLLKKDQEWEWRSKCQAAFDELKGAMSSKPILRLPNLELPFEVQTNVSDRALGGVLVQEGHLVAFENRKLNGAEQWYNTREKEMTIVIHCL